MKFKVLLEAIDKKRFKETGESPEQGGNSKVIIHKSVKGPKETKYEKQVDFEDQIDEILNELMASANIMPSSSLNIPRGDKGENI